MPSTDQPFSLVIFGASGDLARRKLIPALWSLYAARTLPEPFAIIGTGRTEMTDDEFRTRMRDAVTEFARVQPPSEAVWERFASALGYVAADPTQLACCQRLDEALRTIEEAVPAHVLTASLFARFRSRRHPTYADKVLSAMRHGFGGHVEPPTKGAAPPKRES